MRTITSMALLVLGLCLALANAPVHAQKYGGILKSIQRENPNSLSILDESGSFVTAWPMGAVYSNVVYFDPLKSIESFSTVIPELAKSWKWNEAYTKLTFTLNEGVKWHDGKPFTAKDVKHTFDVVRDASPQKLRINPRRFWWLNVTDITTNGDHEVTFHLALPQPSLVLMLACGLSPVYPAHVPLAQFRSEAMGTGPFKLIEYKPDAYLKVRKNLDDFVKGRPYLDGVDYIVIKNRGTRIAALQSGLVDVNQPAETDQNVYEILKSSVPDMEFNKTVMSNNENMLLNHARAPFDNPKLRKAVSMALDRRGFTTNVKPGYTMGAYVLTRPYGLWGLTESDFARIPGYRDPKVDKEEARELMRELGYGEKNHLKLKVTTQQVAYWRDTAAWAIGELKQIYVDGELEIVETGQYYPRMARKEYLIAVNATGVAFDDPDSSYFEAFLCGSARNYSHYCNQETEALFVRQSGIMDYQERLALVNQIERRLLDEVAKITIGFQINYNARRGYVKNFVGHNANSSWARMQDVWLDK